MSPYVVPVVERRRTFVERRHLVYFASSSYVDAFVRTYVQTYFRLRKRASGQGIVNFLGLNGPPTAKPIGKGEGASPFAVGGGRLDPQNRRFPDVLDPHRFWAARVW